uniref:Ovule protein n=1 Tax=Ascaris lumbricoides TaxID=6252 RepID=A0A0M3HWA1_ASCLU
MEQYIIQSRKSFRCEHVASTSQSRGLMRSSLFTDVAFSITPFSAFHDHSALSNTYFTCFILAALTEPLSAAISRGCCLTNDKCLFPIFSVLKTAICFHFNQNFAFSVSALQICYLCYGLANVWTTSLTHKT